MNLLSKLLTPFRKLSRAIGIFLFITHRWVNKSKFLSSYDDYFTVIAFPIELVIFAYVDLFNAAGFLIVQAVILISLLVLTSDWISNKLAKKYNGTKYDNDKYHRVVYGFLICGVIVFVGIISVRALIWESTKTRELNQAMSCVMRSLELEGTDRDSIAAANAIGAADTLLQLSAETEYDFTVRLLKLGLLTRARRFDQARDFVKESDFAKDLYTPGCDDYLNLRIDFFENKARGNDSALAATVRELRDYLRKRVAAPDFEMDSVLEYGVSSKKFRIRTTQLNMLKALTVYFKEPADTAELAAWLRTQYPETEYQFRLTMMPDKEEAEKIVFSALPY